ncbi:hypothetical protein C0991_003459 [Blastosporella zonata]|nr:hypothetical protein C0991_003459 [Blastosporella zonata]
MPLFKEDNKDFETSLVQKPYASSKSLGKRKACEILGRANMDSGPSNTRPAKVSKTGSGQPSTKQAKVPVDILGAHATDKDSVDEGLEGDIAVWVQWSKDWNSAGDTARDAQRWARVVRKREKRAAALVTQVARASDDDKEGPAARPSNTTPAALPTLGAEDKEEISGEGILGVPKLDEGDDGAPVAPEVAEGDGESESAKLVWRPVDEPATEFERVTRCVGEFRELEARMADYAATCEREYAALQFELLQMQGILGETCRLQGTLVEARWEVEEVLWEILAFE